MRRAPINPLANCLITAIPAWRNLVAITIDPMQAPEGLFVEPLRLLQELTRTSDAEGQRRVHHRDSRLPFFGDRWIAVFDSD
jgi:hypothetical protein